MHALPGVPGGGGLVTDAGATRRTIGARSPEQACRSPFSGRLQISFLLSVEMERPPGIEPGSSAWKADARPIGQGRMCRSPFGLMANATGGMPFASQPAPWQLTAETSCAPFAQRAPQLAQGGNRKARKAQTVRALDVSFHRRLADVATCRHRRGLTVTPVNRIFPCEPAVAILNTNLQPSMPARSFLLDAVPCVAHARAHVAQRQPLGFVALGLHA